MKSSWTVARLGEVCEIDKAQGLHRHLAYVGLEDIEPHTARFIGSLEPKSVKSSSFKFSKKHVLYGRLRPYLNKVLAPDFEGHCSTEIFPIKPGPRLSREYLLYWLLADETVHRINATSTGARMPRADMNDVLEFDFPLPPLPEQQRIVGILDEAFDGIATARANAEKNLQNAHALFESNLQGVFLRRGQGWLDRQLGNFAEVQSGGTPLVSRREYWGGDIPWYSSGELNQTYTSEPERYLSRAGLEGSNAKLFPRGSLLVGMYDTAALKMSILDRDAAFNQAIAGVKPNHSFDTEFVLLAINASKQRWLLERRGVRQKNLSLEKIRSITIPMPEVREQRAVVARLRSVSDEVDSLASLYRRKLGTLDELKKSFLHQAFTGQL